MQAAPNMRANDHKWISAMYAQNLDIDQWSYSASERSLSMRARTHFVCSALRNLFLSGKSWTKMKAHVPATTVAKPRRI